MEAVILILKHATFLWLSNEEESALTLAGLDYQKANIDLKIQEYLRAFSPEHIVEEFTHFIMATEIGMLIIAFIIIISHQASRVISVFGARRRSLVEMVLRISSCQVHLGEHHKEEWVEC